MISPIRNNISTVFIHFDELQKAAEWYTDVLGFQIRRMDYSKGYVELRMDGVNLSLLTWRAEVKIRPKHPVFCFYTHDIHDAHRYLREKQVLVHRIDNAGSVSGFQFEDLEGNVLMVCT